MLFKASAPGSLMLLGEYAVLENYPALVCAVDKRMCVTLEPREDKEVHIHSALGSLQTTIEQLTVVNPFTFVLTALKKYENYFPCGFHLTIQAEFSDRIGFASSAAVTVATLSAITAWLNLPMANDVLLQQARAVVREVQGGFGSGADVAACVYGGMVAYQQDPLCVEKFSVTHPISVVYSGSKTPTVQAIKHVKTLFAEKPEDLAQIIAKMGACAKEGITAVAKQNWQELGRVMNSQQTWMDALGVNTPQLQNIIAALRHQASILGAKISGSGLGDCLIGLGESDISEGYISVAITTQGVVCEKD